MLVNKYYYLNDSFTGLDLVNIESNYGTGQMNQEAYNAFKKLSDDARNQGLNILVKSGYRDERILELARDYNLTEREIRAKLCREPEEVYEMDDGDRFLEGIDIVLSVLD